MNIEQKSGTVTVRFDDDMMPYLLEVTKQNKYFTHYQLKYILPMKSQNSVKAQFLRENFGKQDE